MTRPLARSAVPGIQTAMFARLRDDQQLKDLGVTGVWDYVREDAVMPYVVIGDYVETPRNSHDRYGRQVVGTAHVWSRYRGNAEGLAIEARIVELFDHQPLTVEGHDVVLARFQLAQPLKDPDPQIRHVPVRFRFVTEQQMMG